MLDRLLRTERGRLMRQARSHSRRPADAEDALSDACVQFLRFYEGPPGEDALRWMMLVTKRCAWAIGRKVAARESRHRMSARDQTDEALEAIPDDHFGTAELAERREETRRAAELIEQLKPDERTALILLGLGCTHAEIRELRGWSYAKLQRCLSEGKARVRELLERGGSS
ncbi:MAG TPA: RNA polymerase sigma factor [Solirubrobacterales bacterium]|nr:RNA polymerase sigma factor [Solirubrobacterales bacterium]